MALGLCAGVATAGVGTVDLVTVTGVMTTLATSPVTAFFCTEPIVFLALRVALRFAAAAAFC